ncbi:MAG TPA: HAMP domain-containing sensor histidine kinase [Phycisphaerae bacterium]|nr:HAMP domain-containing sensor histidine kinase [Phycisphaerae bacterium]HRY70544.1 HAMP domain-containing sensor histidine kinase [Phycisphaerae bacterium]HSA27992.1 HAMP domain-containing sensor histidine kinase [Phycisphaerae bacterium]
MAIDPDTLVRFLDPADAGAQPGVLSPAETQILELINRKVAAAESLDELLAFLFDRLREISPCDRVSLAFVEENGRRLVSHRTRATYEPLLLGNGYAADLAGSSLETILHRGTPRIISDLERYLEQRPKSASTRLLVREGVRSNLTCPLAVEGRIVGLLFRSSRHANAYQDRHARFQTAIAERLGQAVEKAWRIEQLTAANKAYFEMLGFVTHELKSPVASMLMDAGLLMNGYLGPLEAKQREKLASLTRKGEYLLGLVQEYLDLARLEGGELKARLRPDIDFQTSVVEPSLELVRSQLENKRMELTRSIPPDLPRVTIDPDLVKIVMVNLLSNAAKYGFEGGQILLSALVSEGQLRVSVRNDGPGFSASHRSGLFRKFSRLDVPALRKERGTGVGLYTAWRIIQAHGGRIEAKSEEGRWAEFSYSIPQPS